MNFSFSFRRIPGPDFGRIVGREKLDFLGPISIEKRDYLEELIAKIKEKRDRNQETRLK